MQDRCVEVPVSYLHYTSVSVHMIEDDMEQKTPML